MKYTELNIKIRTLIFIISMGCLLFGCEDSISSGDGKNTFPGSSQDVYLTIGINTLSEIETRSNPTGGEKGDGADPGTNNENVIENLNIILYTGNSINTSLNTGITTVFYIDSEEILAGNTTRVQRLTIDKDIYHLIVIANAGDLSGQFNGRTVREISNYLQKTAWNTVNNEYTSFVMSSASDATVDLTGSTSETNPAFAQVNLQRIAARIDILPNQGMNQTNIYPIIENHVTIATVNVERVKLINRLTAGSYLLKRVADTPESPPIYLGSETPSAGNQTNYVIDPWINLKTTENLTGGHFNIQNGGVGTSPVTDLYEDYFSPDFSLNENDSIKPAIDGSNYYILDYILENTMEKDNQLNGYTTGIMYQTTYVPLFITNYNPSTGANEIINNSSSITFFATGPNNVIYNSLESIELPYLTGTQDNDFFSQLFTTNNTWQELDEYSKRIKDEDPLGFKVYLNTLLMDKTLTDPLNQEVSWSAFVLSTYGYSREANSPIINQNGLDTKELLNNQGIKTYIDGVCYYTYWIRHSNDNTIESAIMEFGIVRNNIYKLRIVSFASLGKPDPYDPDTDNPENPDEESFVKIAISVRPWRLINHSDIIL